MGVKQITSAQEKNSVNVHYLPGAKRYQATPSFDDVTKIGLVIDLATLYRPAKFQLNRTFGS
jgi:hypothetical protein